jgi:hypothetical protein
MMQKALLLTCSVFMYIRFLVSLIATAGGMMMPIQLSLTQSDERYITIAVRAIVVCFCFCAGLLFTLRWFVLTRPPLHPLFALPRCALVVTALALRFSDVRLSAGLDGRNRAVPAPHRAASVQNARIVDHRCCKLQ